MNGVTNRNNSSSAEAVLFNQRPFVPGPSVFQGRSDHPPLLRTSPSVWNIGPSYSRGRVTLRYGMTYNGASIYQYNYQDGAAYGVNGPNGDNYLYPHLQLDAQGSVRVRGGLSLVAAVLNISNEVFGFYNGSIQYMTEREYTTSPLTNSDSAGSAAWRDR
jgi:hypothetical protein